MPEQTKGLPSRRRPQGSSKLAPAAVLVPVFFKEGNPYLLFTQRTRGVRYHSGQISFPGGTPQPGDKSLLDTALRESREEIGLEPDDVWVLGELENTVATITGFLITPFVGVIPYPYSFKPNPEEVEELLEVPLSALLDKANFREEKKDPPYYYSYNGKVIWGATASIVKQLLDLITSPEETPQK